MAWGLPRPPLWAVIVMVVGAVFLAVGIPYAMLREPADPVPQAELNRMDAAEAAYEAERSQAAAIAAEPAALPEEVDSFLVIGDSYTDRTTADARGTYADQLAELMGWPEPVVRTTSGGGYHAPGATGRFIEHVQETDVEAPDVVMIQGGRNDYEYEEIAPVVREVLGAAHERWPNAVIIVPGILWPAPVSEEVAESNAEIISAAAAYEFTIPVDLIGRDFVYELGEDGVHPGAQGQRQLAEGIRSALVG